MRLGFPVAVNGHPALRAYDARRPGAARGQVPHLSVSLAYLRDIFQYLDRRHIRFYRLSSRLAPHIVYPDYPSLQTQADECAAELTHTGQLARGMALRLSLHADASVVLNSEDETLTRRSLRQLSSLAGLLDQLQTGPEAVVVLHVGGIYAAKSAALARFCTNFLRLDHQVRARLALEHDHDRFSLADTLWIQRRTGIRLVFDRLHHQVYNPERMDEFEALGLALSTWPRGVRAKVHIASPRTAFNVLTAPEPGGGRRRVLRPPRWTQHADYVNPFEFADWLQRCRALGLPDFDVMLEARARDLALLRLRADLAHIAPELVENGG